MKVYIVLVAEDGYCEVVGVYQSESVAQEEYESALKRAKSYQVVTLDEHDVW